MSIRRWRRTGVLALLVASPAAAQQRVELPARDNPITSRPAAVWTVGTDEGQTWEMFSSVTALAFDRNDNLYALDQGNFRVLVFDAAGKFVRQFGKQGGGPGEFQFPSGLTIAANGDVVIVDAGRRGYSVFAPDGTYKENVAFPTDIGFPRPNDLYAHPMGGVVTRAMPLINPQAPPTGPQESPVYHMDFGAEGAVRRLHKFVMEAPKVVAPQQGVRMMTYSRPTFDAEPSFGLLPDGRLAIRESMDYEIQLTDPNGRVERVLARPIKARRVTRRDEDDAREARRQLLRSGGGPGLRVLSGGGGRGAGTTFSTGGGSGQPLSEAQIEDRLKNMEFAEFIPATNRITVDAGGRIWVERSPERVGQPGPTDILSADGRYVGTIQGVTTPRAVSRSGLAAWVERNDVDVEQIVVKRLPADWK